jgi:hypothetical protein
MVEGIRNEREREALVHQLVETRLLVKVINTLLHTLHEFGVGWLVGNLDRLLQLTNSLLVGRVDFCFLLCEPVAQLIRRTQKQKEEFVSTGPTRTISGYKRHTSDLSDRSKTVSSV